jgi:hypothetical protein
MKGCNFYLFCPEVLGVVHLSFTVVFKMEIDLLCINWYPKIMFLFITKER